MANSAKPVVMIALDEDDIELLFRVLPEPSEESLYPPHVKRLMKKLEEAQRVLGQGE